jgi:hypothetical protein
MIFVRSLILRRAEECRSTLRNGEREPMDREYDLFEKFPDGSVLWHCSVLQIENAVTKLNELASRSANEYFAFHRQSNTIVASVNVPKTDASGLDRGKP